jgi:hypothetical protein
VVLLGSTEDLQLLSRVTSPRIRRRCLLIELLPTRWREEGEICHFTRMGPAGGTWVGREGMNSGPGLRSASLARSAEEGWDWYLDWERNRWERLRWTSWGPGLPCSCWHYGLWMLRESKPWLCPDDCAHGSTIDLHSPPIQPSIWLTPSLCCLFLSISRSSTLLLFSTARRLETEQSVSNPRAVSPPFWSCASRLQAPFLRVLDASHLPPELTAY